MKAIIDAQNGALKIRTDDDTVYITALSEAYDDDTMHVPAQSACVFFDETSAKQLIEGTLAVQNENLQGPALKGWEQRRFEPRQYRRPRKTTPALRQEIARRYLRRKAKQLELALEYDVSQSTVARCIKEYR